MKEELFGKENIQHSHGFQNQNETNLRPFFNSIYGNLERNKPREKEFEAIRFYFKQAIFPPP